MRTIATVASSLIKDALMLLVKVSIQLLHSEYLGVSELIGNEFQSEIECGTKQR